MSYRRTTLWVSAAAVLMAVGARSAWAEEKKADEKKSPDKKSGTVVGVVTAKEGNWVEVKADGEEKGRKYIPHWRGGAPSAGGGPDKDMVKIISSLKIGSRLEVEWEHEEHFRVLKVKVLKASEKDNK